MPLLSVLICLFFSPLYSQQAYAQNETAAQLMQSVQASLVEVRTLDTKTFNEGDGHTKIASYHTQGSGVIIGSDGIIVTNSHIVTNAPRIFVGLSNGTILDAKLVYSSDADFSFFAK